MPFCEPPSAIKCRSSLKWAIAPPAVARVFASLFSRACRCSAAIAAFAFGARAPFFAQLPATLFAFKSAPLQCSDQTPLANSFFLLSSSGARAVAFALFTIRSGSRSVVDLQCSWRSFACSSKLPSFPSGATTQPRFFFTCFAASAKALANCQQRQQ